MQASPSTDPLHECEDYKTIRFLGRGSFGKVLLTENTDTKELVAIKCLRRSNLNKYVEAEIVNHSLLRHPFVIQFQEVFLTPDHICIVMEHAAGGNMLSLLKKEGGKFSEDKARWHFQQLIIGVDFCHQRGVAIRDIKLDNILLQVGTPVYMAPEVLCNKGAKYNGQTADIWSCGVVMYTMLFGKYPFELPPGASSGQALLNLIATMVVQKDLIPSWSEISEEGCDLLKRILLPKPSARISIADIQQHSWFLTSLPPGADKITATALAKPPPPGYQTPEDLLELLKSA